MVLVVGLAPFSSLHASSHLILRTTLCWSSRFICKETEAPEAAQLAEAEPALKPGSPAGEHPRAGWSGQCTKRVASFCLPILQLSPPLKNTYSSTSHEKKNACAPGPLGAESPACSSIPLLEPGIVFLHRAL